jgi:hypothetical protein
MENAIYNEYKESPMGSFDLPKNQKKEKGAVSAGQEQYGLQQTADRLFTEGTARLLDYLSGKLPKEILKKNEARNRVKDKSYNCINRNFRVLYDLYASNRAAGERLNILDAVYRGNTFNTGEIEKAAFNGGFPWGTEGGTDELVNYTDNILRQKTDTGAIIRNGDTYSVIRCVFKDNEKKPETVTDLNLSINIPDSDLIKPVFRNLAVAEYLVNDIILKYIISLFDSDELSDAGKIAYILDRCEIDPSSVDFQEFNDNLNTLLDVDGIRKNGFRNAVNLLTSLLNKFDMGYQYIDYLMNEYEVVIREYEETDISRLPDENYTIRLRCFDDVTLAEDCKSYDARLAHLQTTVRQLWNIIEVLYQDSKSIFRVNDFDDLARKNKRRVTKLTKANGGDSGEEAEETGDEKKDLRKTLTLMNERFMNMSDSLYPAERKIIEERLSLLEGEFACFDSLHNPHQFKAGMFIDVIITSIKRKKTTLDAMANLLKEYPEGVCRVFTDAALERVRMNKTA